MQEVRLRGRRRVVGALVLAAAGGIAVAVGSARSAGLVVAAGLVVGTLSAFMALGFFLSGRALERGVAAMRSGEHFGSWGGEGRARVDVGATLTVVDEEPMLYALHFERALRVELDDAAGQLVFRVTSNDGNGSVEIARVMPFAPSDRGAALAAGQRLAAHHGVELVEIGGG